MSDLTRPNPEHERLDELLAMVLQAREAIATALDQPFEIMAAGEAWTGPDAAVTFTDDIDIRRRELPIIADDLVDEIQLHLRQTPELLDNAA